MILTIILGKIAILIIYIIRIIYCAQQVKFWISMEQTTLFTETCFAKRFKFSQCKSEVDIFGSA